MITSFFFFFFLSPIYVQESEKFLSKIPEYEENLWANVLLSIGQLPKVFHTNCPASGV